MLDHVAGLEPDAEEGDLAGQPGHRRHRVAQHRVRAPLRDLLAVAKVGLSSEAMQQMPGSVHRAVDVHPGDEFVAEFGGLGSVSLNFV